MLDDVWLRWLCVLVGQRHRAALDAEQEGGSPPALLAALEHAQPWSKAQITTVARQLLTAGLTDASSLALRDEYVNAVLALAEPDQVALHSRLQDDIEGTGSHAEASGAPQEGGSEASEGAAGAVSVQRDAQQGVAVDSAATAAPGGSADGAALSAALQRLDSKEAELAGLREDLRQARLELVAARDSAALLRDELDILRPKAADARRLEASLDRARGRLEAAEVARQAAEAQAAESRALTGRVEALTAELAAVSGARAREASLARVEASGLVSMLAQAEAALAARDKEVEALRAALREKEAAVTLLASSVEAASVSATGGEEEDCGAAPASPTGHHRPVSTRLDLSLKVAGASLLEAAPSVNGSPKAGAEQAPAEPSPAPPSLQQQQSREEVEALSAQLRACQTELAATRTAAAAAQAVASRVAEVEEQTRAFRAALAASEAARDDAIASEQAARVELGALTETLERWRLQRSSSNGSGDAPALPPAAPPAPRPARRLAGLPPTPAEMQEEHQGEGEGAAWDLTSAIGSVTAWFTSLRT